MISGLCPSHSATNAPISVFQFPCGLRRQVPRWCERGPTIEEFIVAPASPPVPLTFGTHEIRGTGEDACATGAGACRDGSTDLRVDCALRIPPLMRRSQFFDFLAGRAGKFLVGVSVGHNPHPPGAMSELGLLRCMGCLG